MHSEADMQSSAFREWQASTAQVSPDKQNGAMQYSAFLQKLSQQLYDPL
jgi:hypothetical protein